MTSQKNNQDEFQDAKYQSTTNQSNVSFENMLKGLQNERVSSLKDIISDIEELIKLRDGLNKEIFMDIEKIKIDINSYLSVKSTELSARDTIEIKKKLIELDEERFKEKLNHFKDVALLRKELRERLADLHEKSKRVDLLDNIVDL